MMAMPQAAGLPCRIVTPFTARSVAADAPS
jgi:hypothetical protein